MNQKRKKGTKISVFWTSYYLRKYTKTDILEGAVEEEEDNVGCGLQI